MKILDRGLVILLAALVLTSCGGGGGSSDTEALRREVSNLRQQLATPTTTTAPLAETTTATAVPVPVSTAPTTTTSTTPPATVPSDVPKDQVLKANGSGSGRTPLFTVHGNWTLEYRFSNGTVRQTNVPTCGFQGILKNRDGSTSGLPSISGAGKAGHGTQSYALGGTFFAEVIINCSPQDSTLQPGWMVNIVD